MRSHHLSARRWGPSVVAATLLGGCAGLVGPAAPTDADLAVSARVSRAEVVSGDTLTVTVVARNPTGRAVRLSDSPCPQFGFEVRSAAGAHVAEGPLVACLAVRYSPFPRLAAGDSAVAVYGWAVSAGPTTGGLKGGGPGVLEAVPGAGVPLAPGTYLVRGVVLEGDAPGARGPAVAVQVRPAP